MQKAAKLFPVFFDRRADSSHEMVANLTPMEGEPGRVSTGVMLPFREPT